MKEISFSPDWIADLIEAEQMEKTSGASDELRDAREDFARLLIARLPSLLTETQWTIMRLVWVEGRTQMETAKILGCNQSSINKTLHGTQFKPKKYSGGIRKKLARILVTDPELRAAMEALGFEPPLPAPTRRNTKVDHAAHYERAASLYAEGLPARAVAVRLGLPYSHASSLRQRWQREASARSRGTSGASRPTTPRERPAPAR